MKNRTQSTGPVRLNATVWGELLRDHIKEWAQDVDLRRKDGSLALQISYLQARLLTSYGMIAGRISNGSLCYFIALVPKQTIIRILRMDPPRPGEVTQPVAKGLKFSRGINIRGVRRGVGAYRTTTVNNYPRVLAPVPGVPEKFVRRVVGQPARVIPILKLPEQIIPFPKAA